MLLFTKNERAGKLGLGARIGPWRIVAIGAIGLSALGLFYWLKLAPPRSVQAFVNSDIVRMRAPVAGTFTLRPDIRVGVPVAASQDLGTVSSSVENPLVSQLRLQEESARAQVLLIESQLAGVSERLKDRNTMAGRFSRESQEEKLIHLNYAKAQLDSATQDLVATQAKAKAATLSEARAHRLGSSGIMSEAGIESAVASQQAAAAEVIAQEARVAQIKAVLAASASDLDVTAGRGLGQPETRLRQLQSELVDLRQQENTLRSSLESARANYKTVSAELMRQQDVRLRAPQDGVMWSIDASSGSTVPSGTPLLQMIDCGNVWVEAFFDESDTGKFAIGQKVRVQLTYGGESRDGTIESIRAGTGRVDVGDYVVMPPPEISRRQLPVRVVAVRVKVAWSANDLEPARFCLAGRSVDVVAE